ncbi:MAG: ATP-binding protein [Aulosira sp. DedVER01a]
MAALMRSLDWSTTAVGAVDTWPQSLKTAVRIMLGSRYPMFVWWGESMTKFYNDAYIPVLGQRHPQALGQPASQVWAEIWDTLGPQAEAVLQKGDSSWNQELLLVMQRNGYPEETYFTFSYSPIPQEDGNVGGVFCACTEETRRVLSDRRLHILRELAANTAKAKTVEDACEISAQTLASNPYDVPFALLYLLDDSGVQARLVGATGLAPGTPASPPEIEMGSEICDRWSLADVLANGKSQLVQDLKSKFGDLPGGAWPESPNCAFVLPLTTPGQVRLSGFLIAGISPRRQFDDDYQGFWDLVAGQITTAIANARAYEAEKLRAEALAEIDRAKTQFFSNVSHEFRTPLTLMLGPTEDALFDPTNPLPAVQRERIEIVQRNALRLLKLVNTLLDFSRIEAGRIQAIYEPTDLATFTAELASVFRSTIEQAGMQLTVDCHHLPEAIYIDREMWEKIVFNLLSNAFKFTFSGTITVKLEYFQKYVNLVVEDTGIGIPNEEIPHLFQRFHRVKDAQGRSFEGSGIGLSLVQEFVKLHGGTVSVTSVLGGGSCFTVAIPTGSAHLPQEAIRTTPTLIPTTLSSIPYVEEAQRWADEADKGDGILTFPQTTRILLADDNADMRDYVKRLLSSRYTVDVVANGITALNVVRDNPPDLVLTDVMMPGIDGFELLRSLRCDPQTQEIPIILLSARAGEESRIEGLAAGADDYIVKPFSARELLARVETNLKLSQLRQVARKQEQVLRMEAEAALRDRQQAEAELRQSQELFQQMADTIESVFWLSDPQAQKMLYVSPAYEKIWGRSCESLYADSKSWMETIHPDDREQVRMAGEKCLAKGNHTEEYRILRPDGTIRWICDRGFLVRDRHGQPYRIAGVAEDISDVYNELRLRKQAEQEREELLVRERAAREEAERANRIKDEFLAVLSHELRSPLNPILGWSKLLQNSKLNAKQTAEALATIERNANLQAQLIEDLLDVSRILRGKLVLNTMPLDLGRVIYSALETVQLAAQAKSLEIYTNISPMVSAIGDATRLQQVVWNILANAVKFTPPGGKIEVDLTPVGSNAQIRVKDTGKGIHPEFLPYVFDHFQQEDGSTTRQFGGLGLGLAIVRQLVELHGGTVAVESLGEGQGATFTVQIPLSRDAIIPKATLPLSNKRSPNLSGIHILVVDDEPDCRELLTFVFTQEQAIVTAVSSGLAALNAINQAVPDILISDIGMPEMDGYMLMHNIRASSHGKSIPAIALTAYAGELNQQKAIAAGFQRHIVKPVDTNVAIAIVVELVRQKQINI